MILFLYIMVIVSANLTSKAVIFKTIADRPANNLFVPQLQNIVMLASIKHSLLHHPSLKCCNVYLVNSTYR